MTPPTRMPMHGRAGYRGKMVTLFGLTFAASLAVALLLDGLVRPRPVGGYLPIRSSLNGLWLQAWLMTALFGLFMAFCGNAVVSAGLALAVMALIVLVSNAKFSVLGEPLLFSDLALIGAVFRHPQFYVSAIALWQHAAIGLVAVQFGFIVFWFFSPDLQSHLNGLAILLLSLAVVAVSLRSAACRDLASVPDADADVRRHGILPTLLLYWLRWRKLADPPRCLEAPRQSLPGILPPPGVVVVVQCESFADPEDLFSDSSLALPGLTMARKNAWQWGNLMVSGFGAYTMRTEYGVLFGRSEKELGFRRYDPYLTALGEASYALPARLDGAGWRSFFVHPHDMRFYSRDRIMPAGGFAELIGQDRFPPVPEGQGLYVSDAAVAEQIVSIARHASMPSLIYAVTIENHGPWAPDTSSGDRSLLQNYLRLTRNSDAMLSALLRQLATLGRPTMLVFFGDHRPSIPGLTAAEGDRHTPYVMVRLDDTGQLIRGDNRRADLTPAQLHHTILDAILGRPELAVPGRQSKQDTVSQASRQQAVD